MVIITTLGNWKKKFLAWLSIGPCYKESMGYHCAHREYAPGKKECGEYPAEY